MVGLDTFAGAVMLTLSVIFLAYGIRNGARNSDLVTGKKHAGVYILIGFALLAMGIMVFLLGVFRHMQ